MPIDADRLEAGFLKRASCDRKPTRECRSSFGEMAPAHRDLVLLHFGAGLRLREIAVVVGKSEPAIHVRERFSCLVIGKREGVASAEEKQRSRMPTRQEVVRLALRSGVCSLYA